MLRTRDWIAVGASLSLLTVAASMAIDATSASGNDGEKDIAGETDREAVLTALEQFNHALNAMFTGNLDPMQQVWSHADDVTYMGPDGKLEIGWENVLANWEQQAALKLGGEIRSEDIHITVGQSLAVGQNFQRGENPNTPAGPQNVSIRATSTFRKEDGQWKLIGLHTDTLPFLNPGD